MIRLLVVDDHEIVRAGLRHILGEYATLEIVGEAGNGDTAIRLNRELRPDVILLDICMPGLSGIELTRRLKQARPAVGIIILTVQEAAPYPERLLNAGASGYLTKGCPVTELVQAIGNVVRGERHVGSAVAQQIVLGMLPGASASPFDELSTREMEVMLMLADGLRIPDIAQHMHLSPKTVATYKYRIFEKLSTRNDVEMTRMAMRYGLVAQA